ncbi:hypothetical protein ONZ45_g56 [Pleurotus djamor]|nr:hypothetical protein ONZ45_g56 [Pleurotus djamor]
MLKLTGAVPPYGSASGQPIISFEDLRRATDRPIVVFPESTTSNGRGLLRFSNVFPSQRVPVKDFGVFVMCVRCDPPTDFSASLSLAIPSRALNSLPHLFSVAKTLVPLTVSIRLLDQADSPSSPLFMVSEVAPDSTNDDAFVETTATLIAQLGKMKRTGMGWENKSRFFEFYQSRKS